MTWEIVEKRDQASPLIGALTYFSSLTKDAKSIWGLNLDFIAEFRNRSLNMVIDTEKWHKIEEITLKKLENKGFIQKMEKGFLIEANKLERFGDNLKETNFKKLSNNELITIFEKTIKEISNLNFYCHWINGCDFHYHLFSKKLMSIIKKHTNKDINKVFAILTTPTKDLLMQKQDKDFLKIIKIIKKEENIQKHLPLLKNHTKKYDWLLYEQEGNPLTINYFKKRISEAINAGIDPKKELDLLEKKEKEIKIRKKKLERKLKLSEKEKYWFKVASKIMYIKVLIREVKVRSYRSTHELMQEIAKRLKLNKTQVRHLIPNELTNALKTGKINKQLINKRINHCVLYFKKEKISIFTNKEANKWSSKFKEKSISKKINKIRGSCACPGKAKGIIKQVLSPKDLKKFNKGDILVAYMTDPGVVPAMKKAAAIITDIGGITCHAAIISRELGIPCIIGTKIATKVLKDNDIVEVDANKGVVKIIKK